MVDLSSETIENIKKKGISQITKRKPTKNSISNKIIGEEKKMTFSDK